MCLKEILKPSNKEITSYVMKNVVFWLCEMFPQSRFTSDLLMYWIQKALLMLKRSIELNFLPYYMIPNRNLLKQIKPDRKQVLIEKISEIVRDPNLVLQCRKIRVGMALFEKQLLDDWQWNRDLNETLLLELVQIQTDLQLLQLKGLGKTKDNVDRLPRMISRCSVIGEQCKATVLALNNILKSGGITYNVKDLM